MKIIQYIFLIGLLSSCKSHIKNDSTKSTQNIQNSSIENQEIMTFEAQIKVFKTLGYEFSNGVTKDLILRDVYEMTWEEETEKHLEQNPYSVLYYFYGWRDSQVEGYNYTDDCIWFDLDFFDHNSQYKWFMERMGTITHGEIEFSEITIETDSENWEWISFKVNGQPKKWKLEKTGYIADHFVQRFSYLPKELNTKGKYTYYDNGGQQWVIDYATEKEQSIFNEKTGLNREWLGDGDHFSEPRD
ncbi:MAG: hypothetical protein DCO95_14145 [Roseivirga sp. XM-24bin3]|nr:MAG: hypothetical protein DCO95_14145 [Roseivirga sp. XM-24bin3]